MNSPEERRYQRLEIASAKRLEGITVSRFLLIADVHKD